MERTLSYEFVQLDHQFAAAFSGDPELPALNRILDLVGAATLQFGLCELFDRRGQRLAAIKDGRSLQFYRMRDQYHQKGIRLTASAAEITNDLVSQYAVISQRPRAALARTTIQAFPEEVMRLVTDSELKPGDVSKIEKVFAEVDDIVLSRKDFAIYITDKLKELESVRSRPDRGNVDNIPMWKAVKNLSTD